MRNPRFNSNSQETRSPAKSHISEEPAMFCDYRRFGRFRFELTRHDCAGVRQTSSSQQLRPIFGGRLAKNLLKHAVEMRKRLESDFKRNLTDTQVRIQQQVLGFLDPDPRKVIGEIDSRDF